jgi:hypothetical protein
MNAKAIAQTQDLIARTEKLKTLVDDITNARFGRDEVSAAAHNPFVLIANAVDIVHEAGLEGIRSDLVGHVLQSGIPIAAVQIVGECLDGALESLHERHTRQQRGSRT